MNKNPYIWTIVTILLVVVIWLLYFLNNNTPKTNLDEFAKCLTEKDTVMYGTYWCSYCKAEKESFGSSFKYINYVECSEQTKICEDEGIDGVPAWKIGGEFYEGLQGLDRLSELSGCALPEDVN